MSGTWSNTWQYNIIVDTEYHTFFTNLCSYRPAYNIKNPLSKQFIGQQSSVGIMLVLNIEQKPSQEDGAISYSDFLWLTQPYTGILERSSSLLRTVAGRRWSRDGASALILRRASAAFRWVLHSDMACSISRRSGSTVSSGRGLLCWNFRLWKSQSITITRALSSVNCEN